MIDTDYNEFFKTKLYRNTLIPNMIIANIVKL